MISFLNRLYRLIFCRGGYGVHSPFVFDLITTVIEESCGYYCYERLQLVRLQISQRQDKITCGHQTMTIKKALKKYGFTEAEHRLLFRLANRFQPKTMLAVGSDFGLTPLYLTAYSTGSACIVVEPERLIATVAKEYIEKYAAAAIDFRNDFNDLPDQLDFVVWGALPVENIFTQQTFEQLLPYFHEESMMVISGINTSPENRNTWKAICAHPRVTVTLDLYRLGIVFFNPKLPHAAYNCVVL